MPIDAKEDEDKISRQHASYRCMFCTPSDKTYARTRNTDVIIMKNGDHLTGEIKGLNTSVLYMSLEYILGTSSIEWSDVAHLDIKQLFVLFTAG
jgi:hypothetical protein